MLSTKDIQSQKSGGGKTPKIFKPGNIKAKVNSIFLQPQKSNPDALFLIMNLEGEDLGPEFEGFLYNSEKPELGRAKGQVARVKFSQYSYKDMVTKSGYPVPRNRQILRDIAALADALGVRDRLDDLPETNDWDVFIGQASKVLNNGEFLHWCVGGNAYLKDDGNKDYTLYLPKYDKMVTTVNFSKNADDVTKFSYDKHVQDDTKKAEETVGGWEAKPAAEKSAGWTPSGFEL